MAQSIMNDKLRAGKAVCTLEIGVHAWRIRLKNQLTGTWGEAPGKPHPDFADAQLVAGGLLRGAIAGVELEEVVAVQGVDGPRWVSADRVPQLERYPEGDEG